MAQNEDTPQPKEPKKWLEIRSAFDEAARALSRIENNEDRGRAVAALALLLDVDDTVVAILK